MRVFKTVNIYLTYINIQEVVNPKIILSKFFSLVTYKFYREKIKMVANS